VLAHCQILALPWAIVFRSVGALSQRREAFLKLFLVSRFLMIAHLIPESSPGTFGTAKYAKYAKYAKKLTVRVFCVFRGFLVLSISYAVFYPENGTCRMSRAKRLFIRVHWCLFVVSDF
jgi:hypothetical protein